MLKLGYKARLAGIWGARSGYPCLICLVPKKEQFDLGSSWPLHTKEVTDALVAGASHQGTKKGCKIVLATKSLRLLLICGFSCICPYELFLKILQNTFLCFFATWFTIFSTFVLDPLHALEQGEFGKHIWPWLLESLPNSSLVEIDIWSAR